MQSPPNRTFMQTVRRDIPSENTELALRSCGTGYRRGCAGLCRNGEGGMIPLKHGRSLGEREGRAGGVGACGGCGEMMQR